MDNIAIKAEHVTKIYKLYENPRDRLKEALSLSGKVLHKDMYALNDISLEIKKGESVGIVGTNGSGKSTLLKILTGVLNTTQGETVINGRLSALLELGAGFNQEYTGIENIYLNGMIMGYSREEISKKLNGVIEFADIGEFINQPVKTYSSGMFVRLAFATQIYTDPDILIVDEALSVGDMRFQQKCYRAMEQMMRDKTVILVSHDHNAVLRFCKRVIWLEKGNLMYDGEVADGIKQYQSFLLNKMESDVIQENNGKKIHTADKELKPIPIAADVQRAGTGDADITECGLFDEKGELVETAEPGQAYLFVVKIKLFNPTPSLIVGIAVKNRLGEDVFGFNSDMIGLRADSSIGESEYFFSFKMPPLNMGQYTISPAVATGTHQSHTQLCWLHDAWIFNIKNQNFDIPGMIYINNFEIYRNEKEY